MRRKGAKFTQCRCPRSSHVLFLRVTDVSDQDQAQVGALAAEVQAATVQNLELAYAIAGTPAPTPKRWTQPAATNAKS